MEFWGVEVKPGEPFTVTPDKKMLIHISQVALGKVQNPKGADSVLLHLKINDQKFVIGTLSAENSHQLTLDFVLERTFELSHDWKDGSVYFCGYTAVQFVDDESDDDLDDEYGKLEVNAAKVKPAKNMASVPKSESSGKSGVTFEEPKKDDESDEDDDDDEDDSNSSEEDSSEDSDDLSESSDEDEMDEGEETPKKVELVKKRPFESGRRTTLRAKNAKLDAPQKTDVKRGNNATKQVGRTPANGKKSEQTARPGGQVSRNSFSKKSNLGSDKQQSRTKGKRGGKGNRGGRGKRGGK